MEGAPVLEVVEAPLDAEDAIRADQPLPEALPVLPLRDSVAFPDTIDPAGGRPAALDQARQRRPRRQPDAGDGRLARPRERGAGPRRPLRRRRRRRRRADDEGARRHPADPRPGRPSGCGSATSSPTSPYLVARIAELPDVIKPSPELEALTRNVQRTFSEIVEQIPYLPEELQLAVANIDDPSALGHLIAGALRIETRGEAGAAGGGRRRQAAAPPLADPRPRARGRPARHPDPVPGPVRGRQRPARVLPPPAAESDPGRARRGRRAAGRSQRTARADRGGGAARAGAQGGRARARRGWRNCRPRPPSTG